jgi:hypothetical protein
MCQNCNNSNCGGCSYTYQNYPCPQFPPAPCNCPPGPPGPQGPPPTFKIVNFSTNSNLPNTPYVVAGDENVILVNSTSAQVLGTGDVYLLPASDPLSWKNVLIIKDAFGQSGIHDIRLIPDGTDTIDGVNAPVSLFLTVGVYGSITIVTNKTNGYNIV